jgi:hypothetical protein
MLTRDAIFAANDLPTEVVPVPEWGGEGATLTVRRLTAAEFLTLLGKVKADPDRAYAYWLVFTVMDDAGNRMFTVDDAEKLVGKSMHVIERLYAAADRLNPTPKKDVAAKNSQATHSDDSSSA